MHQPVESVQFRQVCARFASGVVVATANDAAGTPHGITINSFTSVSLQPPLILFCIDCRSRQLSYFVDAKYFGINILCENQRHVSRAFASRTEERFHGLSWHAGKTGVPLLDGVLGSMECKRYQTKEAHRIGEVLKADCRDGRPLLYFSSQYRGLD